MAKIKFVVLHPAGSNADIAKDECQIPYTLSCIENVDATVVACHIDRDCPNAIHVPGLLIKHIPFIINNALTGAIYLLFNSRKIDWLNIYFAGRQAYLWMTIYKFFNRKGHVYLKLDMDFRGCDLYDTNERERIVFKKNTEKADIVSVESYAIKDRIQKYSEKELLIVEDGISRVIAKPNLHKKRGNTFITAARLGTYQKATDILLEAFEKSSKYHNWTLKLIGNIDSDFEKAIAKFFNDYPDMRKRVVFTGPINDREQLYDEFYSAKVFVLPSRWESFGIAAAEALSCGCYLILSDTIPPAKEMTDCFRYGELVESENVNSLMNALISASQREYSQREIDDMIRYADYQFSWKRICKNLFDEMQNIMEKGDL